MEFSNYVDRLKEFTTKKDVEWEIFLDEFRKINPEPQKPVIEKEKVFRRKVSLGIKFWLAFVAGIGALALSGFRVSERFFAVAGGYNSKINPFFSYGEAFSAVLAVNVTIFALSIAYAYSTGKLSRSSETWGLGTAILVSAVAGLGQAFSGLGESWSGLVSAFDLILAFVLGIGATGLEYFSGDLLGVEIVRYVSEKKAEQVRYETEQLRVNSEHAQKTEQANKEYSEQYKAWIRMAKQQFPNWMSQFRTWNEQINRTNRSENSSVFHANRTNSSESSSVFHANRTQKTEHRTPNTKNRTHNIENRTPNAENRTQKTERRKTEHRTTEQSSENRTTFSELVRNVLQTEYETERSVLSFSDLSSRLFTELVRFGYSEQDASEIVRKKKPQISELRTSWITEHQLIQN